MIKSSQIKQQLYPSSSFVFKGDKGRELCPNLLKTDCVSVCLKMVILPVISPL